MRTSQPARVAFYREVADELETARWMAENSGDSVNRTGGLSGNPAPRPNPAPERGGLQGGPVGSTIGRGGDDGAGGTLADPTCSAMRDEAWALAMCGPGITLERHYRKRDGKTAQHELVIVDERRADVLVNGQSIFPAPRNADVARSIYEKLIQSPSPQKDHPMSKKSTTPETPETDDTPTNETSAAEGPREAGSKIKPSAKARPAPRPADPFSGQFGGMPEGSPFDEFKPADLDRGYIPLGRVTGETEGEGE